jgi:hypothetical protein
VIRGNAHATVHLRTINQFLKLIYLRYIKANILFINSNNVRSASNNMIPFFPANDSTDVHLCEIVSSRSSPSHFTKDTPFNTSQVRTRSTTKKLNHCLEKSKKDVI